jgi:hypothetical protein
MILLRCVAIADPVAPDGKWSLSPVASYVRLSADGYTSAADTIQVSFDACRDVGVLQMLQVGRGVWWLVRSATTQASKGFTLHTQGSC